MMSRVETYRKIGHLFLVAILSGLLSEVSYAQRSWLMAPDSSFRGHQMLIDVHGDGFYRSNGVDNGFLDKMLFGGFIDSDLVDRQQDRIGDQLRIGARYQTGVRFLLMGDSVFHNPDWGWQGNVSFNGHAELAAPGDFFNLIFEGNSPGYLGANADLSNTWIDYMSYQKVGIGVFHKPTLSGFTLSAVNGQDFERFEVIEGDLFTSENGDSLALMYHGHWLRSDTAARGLGSGSGIGAALDGRLNIPLKEGKGYVSLSVNNIGFVRWNEASIDQRADSVFSFTGAQVSELIDEDGDGLPSLEDSLYYESSQGKMTRWLPGWATASLLHTLGERHFFEVAMTFRTVPAFLPELRLGYFRTWPSRTILGAMVHYGGYGGVRFGVTAEQWLGRNWFAALQIEDVYGPVSQHGLGAAAAVRITYMLDRHVE